MGILWEYTEVIASCNHSRPYGCPTALGPIPRESMDVENVPYHLERYLFNAKNVPFYLKRYFFSVLSFCWNAASDLTYYLNSCPIHQ
jgi:hypothetical protein